MVKPMRAELSSAGFKELYNASDVASEIGQAGTTMVVVNSVCGCAARNARPGAKMSLENAKKPDRLVTVFAALFKDGELVHMLERHHIEGRPAEMIAENLKDAFNEFC